VFTKRLPEPSRFGLAWLVHLPSRGVPMTTALSSRTFEVISGHSEFGLSQVRHELDRQPPPERSAATGLDTATMIQAFRTISAEILTDRLVETLMVTAVLHAGVERGVL